MYLSQITAVPSCTKKKAKTVSFPVVMKDTLPLLSRQNHKTPCILSHLVSTLLLQQSLVSKVISP